MHKADHTQNLKNTLLTTGLVAVVAGGVAWYLSDEKNKAKARKIGETILAKGQDYAKMHLPKIEEVAQEKLTDGKSRQTKS